MKIKSILLILSSILLLNSCDFNLNFSLNWGNLDSSSNDNTNSDTSNNGTIYGDIIRLENKNSQYNQEIWNVKPSLSENSQILDTYTESFSNIRVGYDYLYDLPSSGDVEILVFPVTFKDYSHIGSEAKREKVRTDLAYTFFGESTDTGWESVSSYYYKSSYGKLNITGGVSPWFTLDKTPKQLEKLISYGDPTFYVLREAIKWYSSNFDDLDQYDSNNDKVIDSVWLVYDAPNGYSSSDIWWAYTFWDYENTNVGKSENQAYSYAWASYDFMYEGGYTDGNEDIGDAHTYIHETGHLLGLDDYYDYDGKQAPVGCLDMMDGNIGDHNSFSKFLLGWADPIFVNDSTEINLRPFESTGDFILINDSWNKSAFDEYLVIEFYTPTGLNQKDSTTKYPSRPKMFTEKGIRIYHVDARLADLDYQGTFIDYINKGSDATNYAYFAHSNTPSYSVGNGYPLIHILDASVNNNYLKSQDAYATNNALYTEDVIFDPSNTHKSLFVNTGKFNDNSSIGYTVEVISISDTECRLKIFK